MQAKPIAAQDFRHLRKISDEERRAELEEKSDDQNKVPCFLRSRAPLDDSVRSGYGEREHAHDLKDGCNRRMVECHGPRQEVHQMHADQSQKQIALDPPGPQ